MDLSANDLPPNPNPFPPRTAWRKGVFYAGLIPNRRSFAALRMTAAMPQDHRGCAQEVSALSARPNAQNGILETKKPRKFPCEVFYLEPGDVRLWHEVSPTLSLALSGFTSEFEMDSGGSHSP